MDKEGARREVTEIGMLEAVTVITLTRERPHFLKRAIRSVARQQCEIPVYHFIMVDDCQETRATLERERGLPRHVKWEFIARSEGTVSGQGRAALLRNLGVGMVRSRFIAFLDDDNEFEHDHIRNLLQCMRESGCRAVHSWLKIYYRDGKPFLEERDPWTKDPEESRKVFRRMVEKGVRIPDSNIYKNDIDTIDETDPSIFVDTNEWLLERDLLVEVPFPEHYSNADLERMITEDHKFFNELVNNRICISCSRQATVRYYLGGYSNRIV
jgi:glycosyltransferase involved in cell wall biosynthesis